MQKDKQGRPYAKMSELKAGDVVEIDGDFTCMKPWTKQPVQNDKDGLFLECEEGHHYLSGQADDGEHCVGVYLAQESQSR